MYKNAKELATSEDASHVYYFSERWDPTLHHLTFVLLNPLSSTPNKDKVLTRKCMGYAKKLGYGGFIVTYLFSKVSEDIASDTDDYSLIDNGLEEHLFNIGNHSKQVVAAWGKSSLAKSRKKGIRVFFKELYTLGVSKDGSPKKIISLSNNAKLKPFYNN